MYLLITIDTEEDDAWSGRQRIGTENVLYLPRFQSLCERFGYRPTWLTTEPVLSDPRFAESLGASVSAGNAEIGAHLHPWSCAPFPDGQLPDQSEQVYPHELCEAEFRAKMERIVGLIRERFGQPPVSYRAGRWGFVREHVPWLLELGIRIDCSVTPHMSWHRHIGKRGGKGGVDYRGAPRLPYWLDPADILSPGRGEMLELPLTVSFLRGPLGGAILRPWADRFRYTPLGALLHRVGWTAIPFRPWPGRSTEVLLGFLPEAKRARLPYLMLMFHSSELMPGGSPYNRDADDVERMYVQLETLFGKLRTHGVEGATLTQFAEPYFQRTAVALGRFAAGLA